METRLDPRPRTFSSIAKSRSRSRTSPRGSQNMRQWVLTWKIPMPNGGRRSWASSDYSTGPKCRWTWIHLKKTSSRNGKASFRPNGRSPEILRLHTYRLNLTLCQSKRPTICQQTPSFTINRPKVGFEIGTRSDGRRRESLRSRCPLPCQSVHGMRRRCSRCTHSPSNIRR